MLVVLGPPKIQFLMHDRICGLALYMAAFKKSLLFTKICILGVSLLIKINSP
jgi:hypothetical protein